MMIKSVRTKSKIIFTILSVLICCQVKAGNPEKGFERLRVYDFFKAKEYFEKSLKKNPVPAAYGLGIIYSSNNNPFYHLDSARVYILLSDSLYPTLKEKYRLRYAAFGFTRESLSLLKDSLCIKSFQAARQMASVERLNHYMEKFSFCNFQEEALELRNAVAFQEVRNENTSIAYKRFIDTYPDASEYTEAKNRYLERQYEENTDEQSLASYENFLKDFPENPYRTQAEQKVFQLSVPKGTIKELVAFIKKYPSNKNVPDAWREIYRISMLDFSEKAYHKFLNDYPEYPFRNELEMDYKLQTSLFLPCREKERWGYINEQGQNMIPALYEEANLFSEGLAVCMRNGKYGYINKTGKTIIPFLYDDAEPFHNHTAVVGQLDKYGLINRNGDLLIPVSYDELNDPSEGICAAVLQGMSGYVKLDGKPLLPFQFEFTGDFKNGFAIVGKEGYSGLLTAAGNYALEPKYDALTWLGSGLLLAEMNEKFGAINTVGEIVIPILYDGIGELSENRILIAKNGKCGFANRQGNIVIPLNYRYTESMLGNSVFKNAYVQLEYKGKITVLDSSGVKYTLPGFEQNGLPGNRLIPVQRNRKWGFADLQGKLKIACTYDAVRPFQGDVALFRLQNRIGVIDTAGNVIVAPVYDDIVFDRQVFVIRKDGKSGLLNKEGNLLSPCIYDRLEFLTGEIVQLEGNGKRSYMNFRNGKMLCLEE